jgi:hypothetical protein
MSTKRFCDICDEPAVDERQDVYYRAASKVLSDRSAKIAVRISFSFEDHSTGFGGPPDLCKNCRANLIVAAKGTL